MQISKSGPSRALASFLVAVFTIVSLTVASIVPPAWAAPDYNHAVADYNAGKYGQAASEFEALKAAYPTNALTRYYLALCRQALGHFDKAREEYRYVATNGDARLKAMAKQGMQAMSGAKSSLSSSAASPITGSGTPASGPGSYQPPFANASNSQSTSLNTGAKVKTILKFTAPWCAVCQKFAPVFEAVQPQFRDVSFEAIDFDSNQDLRAKYGVTNVPHLVLLDASGKVLYSRAGAPRSAESFAHLIQSYH